MRARCISRRPIDVPTTYRNLIAGEWRDAASGRTFTSVSPADHDDVVGVFAASGPEDV
jgi:aldehyde dehydrogenase (NAD+)